MAIVEMHSFLKGMNVTDTAGFLDLQVERLQGVDHDDCLHRLWSSHVRPFVDADGGVCFKIFLEKLCAAIKERTGLDDATIQTGLSAWMSYHASRCDDEDKVWTIVGNSGQTDGVAKEGVGAVLRNHGVPDFVAQMIQRGVR